MFRFRAVLTGLQEVLGLPTTHSWIEMFESGFRAKLPNIPFLAPTAALTLEHPFDSRSTGAPYKANHRDSVESR